MHQAKREWAAAPGGRGAGAARRVLAWLVLATLSAPVAAIEVAITVDDLPFANPAAKPSRSTWHAVTHLMLDGFERHGVHGVYGFANGAKAEGDRVGENLLAVWVERGQLLGNHTYSHLSFTDSSVSEYLEDIEDNHEYLARFSQRGPLEVFRYPYLQEGDTRHKREVGREYLESRGYEVAPVTVDFADWKWNAAYLRCVAERDHDALAWLRESYLHKAVLELRHASETARETFGRDIKHIALLHITPFSALMTEELLSAFKAEGARIIPLAEALADPVYDLDLGVAHHSGLTWTEQLTSAHQSDGSPSAVKVRLKHICS